MNDSRHTDIQLLPKGSNRVSCTPGVSQHLSGEDSSPIRASVRTPLRRTFATQIVRAGVDLVVAELLGHRSGAIAIGHPPVTAT